MKKIFILIFSIFLLTGCTFFYKSPSKSVEKFLNNYKDNSESVITELNNYLDTEELSKSEKEKYKEVYIRQYSNLKYIIKNEKVDGNKALVDVQITVYDYNKVNKESNNYFLSNQDKFIKSNGDIDIDKYFNYKINRLIETKDTITYTLTLKLNKVNDVWEIEPLTSEQLSKLHGTYE